MQKKRNVFFNNNKNEFILSLNAAYHLFLTKNTKKIINCQLSIVNYFLSLSPKILRKGESNRRTRKYKPESGSVQ